MAECDAVCEHAHLPLQSGSTRVLKAMRRTYGRERYLRLVEDLRAAIPDLALTTDIIVGFPGETDRDFDETLEVVQEVGYDGAFTFVYSPRQGTEAATAAEQVPEEVKKERIERLVEIVQDVALARNRERIGRVEAGSRRRPEPNRPRAAPWPHPPQHDGQLPRDDRRRKPRRRSGSKTRLPRPSRANSSQPLQRSRDLLWDGLLNVRDLGGHPTEDGDETRYDSIIRADSVRQLSDQGWTALVDYGVKTIIDLRANEELEADPPAELPVEVLHIPFFETHTSEWKEIEAELESAARAAPDVPTATREVYLIFLEHFGRNVATAIRAVADAPEGGVVIHCAGGKDRTGLLTALLLHVAGVGIEEIAADYALSEERLRPRHEQWFAEAESDEELERMQRMAQTPAASIEGVFAELERRHGSVEGYLRDTGLTDAELDRARARLRD